MRLTSEAILRELADPLIDEKTKLLDPKLDEILAPRMLTSCLAAAIRLRHSLLGSTPGESTPITNRARGGSGGMYS